MLDSINLVCVWSPWLTWTSSQQPCSGERQAPQVGTSRWTPFFSLRTQQSDLEANPYSWIVALRSLLHTEDYTGGSLGGWAHWCMYASLGNKLPLLCDFQRGMPFHPRKDTVTDQRNDSTHVWPGEPINIVGVINSMNKGLPNSGTATALKSNL